MRQRRPFSIDTALHGVNVVGTALSILIALCMFLVPFLLIDRNFHITPGLSLANAMQAFDPLMIDAIRNSVLLSILASLFAISCGALITRCITRFPLILVGLVLVYAVNPVTRAVSYAELFTITLPIQQMATTLFGEWPAQMILLPSLILGTQYMPVYLMRFLFVIRKERVTDDLRGLLHFTFASVPSFLRGMPISFSIFFLLTFFDYWVIQTIGGGKALYWSQMFEQKAFVARDIGQAGMLIILGLALTVLVYILTLLLCTMLRRLLAHVRPLRIARIRLPSLRIVGILCTAAVCLFFSWPLLYSVIRFGAILRHDASFVLMNAAARSIGLTILLSSLIALCSTLGAFVLSVFFRNRPRICRWWLPSLYFLALVPEAAYVLFSLTVTGSGLLKASPLWLFFLMTSFTMPMSFFLFESLWGETEERKLLTIVAAMRGSFLPSLSAALREWRRFFALTFVVNLWMTVDNVFITNFAAGPKWKPLSATIFTATKRGFQDAEFLTGSLGSLSILAVACIALLAGARKKNL